MLRFTPNRISLHFVDISGLLYQLKLLFSHNPLEILHRIPEAKVRIGVKCDTDLRMSHDVLKVLRIQSSTGHLRREGVSADMRRNDGHRFFIMGVILGTDMLEIMLPVHSNHWAQ